MKVKLIKGYSYSFGNKVATKNKPIIEVSDEAGAYLISTGSFITVEDEAPLKEEVANNNEEDEGGNPPDTNENDTVDVSKMKVDELNKLAEELGVEFPDGATKPEKAEILTQFLNSTETE